MDALGVIEQEILAEVMQEILGIADGIFMDLDKLLEEGSLVPFDTAIDARATGVAPMMGDMLSAEKSVELAFELRPVIGLYILDRYGTEALQFFEEVPGIMAIEAGIGQGERQLGFDIDGGVKIYLELIQFTHHRIHLPVTLIGGVRGITHPFAHQALFPQRLSPFRIRIVINPTPLLEEQPLPLDDLADR